MGKSIDKVKVTLVKLRKGLEMHKSIEKVNKFLKDNSSSKQKKGAASAAKEQQLPSKDKILSNLAILDSITKNATKLPTKQEIE